MIYGLACDVFASCSGSQTPESYLPEVVSIFQTVKIRRQKIIHPFSHKIFRPLGDLLPVHPLKSSDVPLEKCAGILVFAVMVLGTPQVSFRMGQNGDVAVLKEGTYLFGGVEGSDPRRIAYGKFDEDMVSFPWHEPSLFQDFGPGLLDDAVFHGGDYLERNVSSFEFILQDVILLHYDFGRVLIEVVTV